MLESLEGKRGKVRCQAAGARDRGSVRQADDREQRALARRRAGDPDEGGADFYTDFGMGRSRGTLPIQLAGNIKHGGLVEKAFGVTLRDLVDDYGGGTWSGRPLRAVQVGGPLGAYFPAAHVRPADGLRGVRGEGGMIGHGGIVVFDDTVDMARRRDGRSSSARSKAAANARRAESDRRAAVKLDRSQDHAQGDRATEMGLLRDLCDTMTYGSLCALGGLTPFPV